MIVVDCLFTLAVVGGTRLAVRRCRRRRQRSLFGFAHPLDQFPLPTPLVRNLFETRSKGGVRLCCSF